MTERETQMVPLQVLRERARQAILAVEPTENEPYAPYVWAGQLADAVIDALGIEQAVEALQEIADAPHFADPPVDVRARAADALAALADAQESAEQ